MIIKRIYDTKNELATEFCEFLEDMSFTGDDLHIALSGGSTPKIVFDTLAKDFTRRIDWKKIHLYWGDERCVSPDDDESNYKMTADHLLSKIDIPEENIHRIHGEAIPFMETDRYSKLLQDQLPEAYGAPQFDLVILGLGEDGHTASVFPHEINLWDSDDYCEVATHPINGQKRITLTGKLINNAKNVAFLVTGSSKAARVQQILKKKDGYTENPASLVAPKMGKLYWFLDDAAASEL
jgi:6-phosphogluconolactonase